MHNIFTNPNNLFVWYETTKNFYCICLPFINITCLWISANFHLYYENIMIGFGIGDDVGHSFVDMRIIKKNHYYQFCLDSS